MTREISPPMRRRSLAVLVPLVLFVALTTPAADAARTLRYSGTVAAIDLEDRVMILEEVGPWRVERGATVVTRRTISLAASTTYNLFMRVNAPGAFAGDFIEVPLDVGDVAAGDFVTAECVRRGGRLVALTVTVAELEQRRLEFVEQPAVALAEAVRVARQGVLLVTLHRWSVGGLSRGWGPDARRPVLGRARDFSLASLRVLASTAAGSRLRDLRGASALFPGGPAPVVRRIPCGDVIGIALELAP